MSVTKTSAGAAKVYTKGGDKGKTSLIGGARVSKAHVRLEVYGTVDELNSCIGLLRVETALDLKNQTAESSAIADDLDKIQNDLFDIGSHLACEDAVTRAKLPALKTDRIAGLEQSMDTFSQRLLPLKNFVLPGGARSSSLAHIARTVCRRTERLTVSLAECGDGEVEDLIIQYLNRLSDYFFVLARFLNHLMDVDEPIWGKRTEK